MNSGDAFHDSPGGEEKWQRHVMAVLWVSLALFVLITTALVLAEGRGWFHSVPEQSAPPRVWPGEP